MSRGTRSTPAPDAARPPRPGARAALAAAALVPCLPFLTLLATGRTLWFRDWSLYFVPMKALLVDLWRAGELPLWDPFVRGGLPFLANPQAGVLYPPSLLLVVFGLDPGLTLFLVLHVAAAGAGFHLLLREVEMPRPAALLGGIAFAAGGYLASLVNVLNNLQAVAWIPWMLFFAVRTSRRPGRGSWLGLAAATALALLAGELQLAALGGLLAAGLAALEAEPRRPLRHSARRAAAGVALVGLAGAAAAGLSAVQLLPTGELVRESVRSAGLPFELAADESLEPRSLFGVAFPRPVLPGDAQRGASVRSAVPWLLSGYAGVVVTWLAVVGCAGPRRRWTFFWTVLAVTGAVLALGRFSPLFRAAYELLPPFRSVRYPEKFLLLTALALPALAAAGLEGVLARRWSARAAWAGLGVLAVAAAGSLLWMDDPGRPSAAAAGAGALAAAGAAGAVLVLVRSNRLEAGVGAGLLCAVAAVDLLVAGWGVNPSVPWKFYEEPWAAGVLRTAGADPESHRVRSTPLEADMEQVAVVTRARIFSNHYLFQHGLAPNLGQLHGWMHQDGLSGLETRATAEQIDALLARPAGDASDLRRRMRLLCLQSVGWVVTSFPLPREDVVPVAVHPELPLGVVRVRDALPRAYLATEWEVTAHPPAALERALAPGFPRGRRVVLDREPRFGGRSAPRPAPGRAAASGRVREARWGSSAVALEVSSASPALLVVTDGWYPGWRATLDGSPARLLRANGYGRAIAVPPGDHRVEMAYRPASLVVGALVSLGSAAATALALVLAGRTPRQRPAPTVAPASEEAPRQLAGVAGDSR